MALVNMKDMLEHAYRNRYAVGAFDLVGLEFLEGIIQAAEECRAPVILSLAESHFGHYDFELLMPAVEAAAERAAVPVAIHFDHGATLDSATRAINQGCNGVMVDASMLSLPENISHTKAVVDMAHACGVPVEGELGYVAGTEGENAEHHPGELVFTSVEEARVYVQRTDVDFLAVSIGTVHGHLKGRPRLDFQRLARINEALGMPLVIHGGTGLADDQFARLIANGVAKINYYTALSDAAAESVRGRAGDGSGYATLLHGVRDAVAEEVSRCMRLWGSAGRAAEVLMQCRPWQQVEHLIIYNVEGLDEAGVDHMMAEGRRVLSAIPGVRRVFTGETVKDGAAYRYSWLVRFTSREVIDSYREHPAHKAFADNLFRAHAGERISIDYQDTVSTTRAGTLGEAESLRA
jgi:fructose-bisphosphate aldolase class II